MYQLKSVSMAIAIIGFSTVALMGQSIAAPMNNTDINNAVQGNAEQSSKTYKDISPVTNGVSQKLTSDSQTATSLNKLLPTIKYTTDNLSDVAQKVNNATWKEGSKIDRHIATKLQALLNWHHHGVGHVDGYWGKNTRKAMQAFQKARGLTVTGTLNSETWQALTRNDQLMKQPVLVNYQLSDADSDIKTTNIPVSTEAKAKLEGLYYESMTEAFAEKFHMSERYLKELNPKASFVAGETINCL
ncbi:MAG: peptidoglycan-binding domain-containing protein [Psychrobacter sp.]|nr:peptidoglycan-binding protein [Psychrobacter sp. FME13]